MLFPTIDFAIFFGIVFVLNWLLAPFPKRWKIFAIVASYVFYGWFGWSFVFLLAGSTVVTTLGGKLIYVSQTRGARRFWMWTTVTLELGLLAWFKYYGFLAVSVQNALRSVGIDHAPLPLLNVTVPVGVSFFTFMGLSYVIDIYRGNLKPSHWLDVAVFVCFFPHLAAGPIVRGSELLPQVEVSEQRSPRDIDLPRAAYLIFGGLFKKIVLSSYISTSIVNPVFANPGLHSGPEALFAVWGYAVQIYCDFSGYTDIAIGCALLLGFKFPENFNSPYTARSLQDFWRRWHMTLSFWLRDYLYIPLGGSKVDKRWKLYKNLFITMLLGGLWHGAAWTFVAWGALHGVGQTFGHWRRQRRVSAGLPAQREGRWAVAWQRFATFQFVCLGWVFFRATSFGNAFDMLQRMLTGWGLPSPLVTIPVCLTIACGIGTQFVSHELVLRVQRRFGALKPALQGTVLAGALLVMTTMGPPGVAPFIYFRF
ncbi:MAG: MBOAT family O-acyltransferase [Acidimicrobiales bacterium]